MVSEAVQVALIAAVVPTVGIIASALISKRGLQKNHTALEEIHVLVNSRLAEVTEKLSALEAIRDAEGEAAKRIVLERAAKDLEVAQPPPPAEPTTS